MGVPEESEEMLEEITKARRVVAQRRQGRRALLDGTYEPPSVHGEGTSGDALRDLDGSPPPPVVRRGKARVGCSAQLPPLQSGMSGVVGVGPTHSLPHRPIDAKAKKRGDALKRVRRGRLAEVTGLNRHIGGSTGLRAHGAASGC